MVERRSTKTSSCCWWFWRLFARRQRKPRDTSADNTPTTEDTQDTGHRGAEDHLSPIQHSHGAEGDIHTRSVVAVEQKTQPTDSDKKGETLIITITLVKREKISKELCGTTIIKKHPTPEEMDEEQATAMDEDQMEGANDTRTEASAGEHQEKLSAREADSHRAADSASLDTKRKELQKCLAESISTLGDLRGVLASWKADITQAVKEEEHRQQVAESFSLLTDIRNALSSWKAAIEEAETTAEEHPARVAASSSGTLKSQHGDVQEARQARAPAALDGACRSTNRPGSKQPATPRAASPPLSLLLRPRGTVFTFLSDVVDPPATLVMGADKHENDHLIGQATERVVFFHVDDLPSAHVYLQLQPGQGLRDVPAALLQDAAQLCKANSTQGNRLHNVAVIYTPGSNLHKTRHMKPGEVAFVRDREVRKVVVKQRDDKVLARLNDTKRKIVSPRLKREKEQRARERQVKQAKAKEERRQQRRQAVQQAEGAEGQDGAEGSLEQAWATAPVAAPSAARTAGRRQRRRQECCTSDEGSAEEAESPPGQQTSRCFPVGPEQRRLLQGCRAALERRHDVRIDPPAKGAAEGHGTVTGAAEDVAEALAELRKILHPATPQAQPHTTKVKGKAAKSKLRSIVGEQKDLRRQDKKALMLRVDEAQE